MSGVQLSMQFDPGQEDQRERFRTIRDNVRDRLDVDYITNDQMLVLMMDVYEHHLDADPGPHVSLMKEVEGAGFSDNTKAVTIRGDD